MSSDFCCKWQKRWASLKLQLKRVQSAMWDTDSPVLIQMMRLYSSLSYTVNGMIYKWRIAKPPAGLSPCNDRGEKGHYLAQLQSVPTPVVLLLCCEHCFQMHRQPLPWQNKSEVRMKTRCHNCIQTEGTPWWKHLPKYFLWSNLAYFGVLFSTTFAMNRINGLNFERGKEVARRLHSGRYHSNNRVPSSW